MLGVKVNETMVASRTEKPYRKTADMKVTSVTLYLLSFTVLPDLPHWLDMIGP